MHIERLLPLLSLALAAIYLYATETLPMTGVSDPIGSRAFPRLLGFCLAIASIAWFVENLRAARSPRGDNGQGVKEPSEALSTSRGSSIAVAIFVLWTFLYFLLFEPIGFLIGTIGFLTPIMLYFNPGRKMANVLIPLLFSGVVYFTFTELLGVYLPPGILTYL